MSEQRRQPWRETLLLARDLARADVLAATKVITTFLFGMVVEYLNWPDRRVQHRVHDLAYLLGPSLCGRRE